MRPREENVGHGPEHTGALDKRRLLSMSRAVAPGPGPGPRSWPGLSLVWKHVTRVGWIVVG